MKIYNGNALIHSPERQRLIETRYEERKEEYFANLPFEERLAIKQENEKMAELETVHAKSELQKTIYAYAFGVSLLAEVLFCIDISGNFERLGQSLHAVILFIGAVLVINFRILWKKKKGLFEDTSTQIIELRRNLTEPRKEVEFRQLIVKEVDEEIERMGQEEWYRRPNSPWKCDPIDFERNVAQYFSVAGYKNVEVTPTSGDYGADILAESSDGKRVAIQCKQYTSPVGQAPVQEVLGGIYYYHCDTGYVVTTVGYTKAAKELAHRAGVRLFVTNDATYGLDEVPTYSLSDVINI